MIVLERIEGEIALLETENGVLQVPVSVLPFEAKEGDLLVCLSSGKYAVDRATTQKRRLEILEKQRRIFENENH